jgi:hypothetical protein
MMSLASEDITPNGYAIDRATVRQKKTGQPVKFELTEQNRQVVDDYPRVARTIPIPRSTRCRRVYDDAAAAAR